MNASDISHVNFRPNEHTFWEGTKNLSKLGKQYDLLNRPSIIKSEEKRRFTISRRFGIMHFAVFSLNLFDWMLNQANKTIQS